MPRIITLPDTRRVQIPDGIDDAQAFAVAKQYFPNSFPAPEVEVQEPVKPPEQGGIFSDLFSAGAKGAKQMASQSRTGIASLFGNAEEQALAGIERSKDLEEQYKNVRGTNVEKIKEPFKRGEYGTAALEAISQSPYAIAENLPQIAGMGIGTVLGTALGGTLGTLVGPGGTVAGGAAGAVAGRAFGATVGAKIGEFLVSAVQQRGSNVERQAQEQIQRGEPVNIDSLKASAAAAGQGVADVISYRLLGGANIVGKILGKTEDQVLKLSAKKAESLLQESFTKTAAKGLGTGFLAELPAEIGQTMLERWQAGLELTSPDALGEYGDTAIGVGLLAPLAAAGRFSQKSTAKGVIKQQEKLTQFDRIFTGLVDQNMGSGNFTNNSDSLYDARDKALSQAAVGTTMTVYDSVGRDTEATITGYTEAGIPTIKVDETGTDRNFILGQEFDVISPVNKDIRLSDNTPVSQLSREDVQSKIAILKPLVDSNRIEQAKGNDLVQHHVMERDLAALAAQDAINATIPVSAKAAINKGNKEKRDRVKANGVSVVNTGATTPLTTAKEAPAEVTTEPLAAPEGQVAATPLPVVDQAAEDVKQAEIPQRTVAEIMAESQPTVDPNTQAAADAEQAAIDEAIEEEAKKQEEDAAFKRAASGGKRAAKPQTATAFLLKKGPLSKTFTGTDVRTDIYGDKKGINQRLFSGTLGLDDAATMLRLAGWDITEGNDIDDIKRILRDEANGIKHYAAKDQEEVFRRQAENDQRNKQAAAAAEVNAPLLDDQGETTLTYAGDKSIPFSKASGKAAPAYKVNTEAQKLIATIKEERQKKRYEAALPRVALLIAKRMKQLGVDKYINVEKLRSIAAVGADGKTSMEGKVNGAYVNEIIKLAIAGKSDAQIMSTLNHEAIHAMRELGMITESEWANLTKVVENKGWIDLFQIPTRYTSQNLEGKTEDEILTILSKEAYFQNIVNGKSIPKTKVKIKEELVEEAIADAFSTYATGRSPIIGYLDAEQTKPVYINKAQLKLGGQPVGIITRLIRMLKGIREVVSGEDVFKRIQDAPMERAVAPAAVAATNPKKAAKQKLSVSTRSSIQYSKTPEFKRFTHGNQIINLNEKHKFVDGVPVVVQVVHGTTGDYEYFDRSKLNQESDLGAGFYFTNSLADVNSNYAGMGPDLTNKVERTAERIASETDREYNDPDVIEEARNQFLANEGQVMPVYVRFDNPVVLGGKKETFLDFDQNYNKKTEEYGEPTGKFVDFVEAFKNIAGDERYGNVDVDKVVSDLYEKATDNDGISANDLIKTAKKSDGLVYAEDYEKDGELASTEIIRLAFEEIGYDGFIDQTVVNKFSRRENIKGKVVQKPMEGVTEDTVHFIAFKQNQVKSSVGNLGSYGERSLTKGELEQEGITAEEAKVRQKLGYIRYSITSPVRYSLKEGKTIDVDGVSRSTLNSMGNPIHSTETGIRNFWRWFGNSKMVDVDGKPLVVYHGTATGGFTTFSNDGGFWFTESLDHAASYAGTDRDVQEYFDGAMDETDIQDSGVVYSVYLKSEKLLVVDFKRRAWTGRPALEDDIDNDLEVLPLNAQSIAEKAREDGYDGVLFKNIVDPGPEENVWGYELSPENQYVVFDKRQIKSATGNRGTFDPKNANIRYSLTSPVWYSELSRQIDKLPQKEMTAAEWKALLVNPAETKSRGVRGPDNKVIPGKFITTEVPATSKLPGVKMREIDDTEILEWLDVAGTSFEVDDYIDVLNKKYGTKDVIEDPYGVTRITSAWEDSDLTADELRTLKSAQSGGSKNTKISTAEVQQFLADGGSRIEFQDVILGKKFTNAEKARQFLIGTIDPQAPEIAKKAFLKIYQETNDKDAIQAANSGAFNKPTKFEAYKLPGGENYREAFVTVPNADSFRARWIAKAYVTLRGKWVDGHGAYFGIDNPVVRIRFDDRIDAEGKKVLFLQELQPPNNPEFEKMPKSLQDRWLAIGLKRMIRHAAEEGYDKIAWTTGEQQVERYRDALRKTVDSIEWKKTPEGVHIKGYKGSEYGNFMPEDVYDNVNAALNRNDRLGFDTLREARRGLLDDGLGTAWLNRWDMRGAPAEDIAAMQDYIDASFKKTQSLVADTTYKETDLTQAIGKLMADRIRNDPSQTGTIEGEDLSIDSVGVKKLYDVGVPSLANKILKEMGGGKVGETRISLSHDASNNTQLEWNDGSARAILRNGGEIYILDQAGHNETLIKTEADLDNELNNTGKPGAYILGDKQGTLNQPSFDITPPLREKAMSGVSRYSKVAKTEEQKAVDKGNLRVKNVARREGKLGSAAIVSAKPGDVVATITGITSDKIKNLHRRAAAIINTKAAKAFFATLGATDVEAITIGGLWKGVAEPSFFLTAKDANGDNLPYDKMRGIANILASAFQQDAAITSEGIIKPKKNDEVNTTLFLGKSDGSVLNEREINGVFKELTKLKIDGASITTDNKAFKVLWFSDDKINKEQNTQNLEAFSTGLRDAVKAYGIDGYYLGYTHSNLDDLLEKKDGVYRSRSKESLREAWDTDVAGRSSLLFGGATDHFLVPYILSVKAEGGQFDFARWQYLNQATDAERAGLEQKVLAYDAIVNEVGLSPEEAASVNLLIGRTGLGDKDTFAIGKVGGLPAIVRHLDEQRNASGLRKLDVNNEDDRETLSKLMAAEAVAAVRGSGNAIDWYDAEIKKTLDIMAVKYPELTTDPVARLAFRIAMAITSQTLNVEANFRFAMKQYEGFRKSKSLRKFPIDGEGKSISPMKANFTKANYLLAALGPTTFPRFLVTDFTVKELSNVGIKINGESMDTNLLGSVVFGPKIGYGFLSNLMGNFEPTTFDMWFMRMVGRLTGNLPQFKQNLFDNQVADFIESFDDVGTNGVYADKFDPKLLRDVANSTDDAAILKLAKEVVAAHEADYKKNREQYDPKFGIPTRYRTPFVSAAFGIVKSLEKPKDSPASGTERNNLRDVMKKLVAKMTKLNGGVRIPPAALQALVWYPEQFLYESMGAKLRVTGQSYSGAATKIIKETKITPQQKEAVEKIASRKAVPGVAVEKAAVPFTQAEKDAFLNKYKKDKFNIIVKESDDADVIQDIEDETPGKKVTVKTQPFSIARFIGDTSKEKRSVVPDTNFYRAQPTAMSLADYMSKPIYLYVGTEKNTLYQKPYGLMHILDNAAKSTARRFENLTDKDSDNAVLGVMNILGARDVVAYSETAGKVLLRSESNKAYVVLGDGMKGWSVISVVPSMDARKFGNAIINRGQKVILAKDYAPTKLVSDIPLVRSADIPLVRSIEFVPYSKAPSVEVKKRRVVEIPKMSIARYSGATIPKYPTTLLGGASIPRAWQSPASDKLTNLQYIFTDKFIDLKNVMKAITSTMGQVSDQFNAYLREELFHGRVAKQVFDFAKDELRPLLASMQSLNVTIPEIELYLQNRTAESYNTKIAAIGGMADGGSGIKTADARAYLASIPPAKLYAYTSLAKRVDAMTKQTRELMVAGGLEDRATINAWETANPQYVPLQRDLGRDEGVSGMGQGFSVTHKVARAMGSTKSVKDILANIIATRERTIVKSEKNKIGQAILGLALKAPNPDYWLAIDPNGNKNKAANFTDLLNMGLSINEATMIAQEPKVRYTDTNTGMIAERVNPMIRNMPNVLHVMVNGKERLVIFNPDEKHPSNRLVRTLKNLDIGELGPIMGWVAKVTRWIAAINTQYNPIFGVINFLRDYQTGLLNLTSTPLAGMQGQIAGDTFPAMMGIFAQMRSYKTGVPATGKWAKLYEDFEKAGGPTGYREMFATAEDRADALASEFKQLTEGRAKKIGRGVMDALSNYNTAMENAVRLAAFSAGLDKGLSVDKAASIAKNLTVNFNRKGDIAMQAGALYAFFNASAQGSARIAQTLAGPAGRKILGGALTLGVMQAVALAAAGFGDDEPPEFIKDKNLVIPTGDGKYITIPMPLGFNIVPSFSRMMTEVTFYGKGNQAKKIVSWMNGAFGSLNPLGGGVAAQTIFPSAVDPIIALLQNKDAFGRRIYKEDISGLTPTAGYLRTKETATPWAKGLAEFMNMATGGTQFKQGIISPTPDQIDYLIGQATGGIGRESAKIAQTISSSATGEELPSYKIPLVSRFFGDTKEGASEANKFYDNLIRVNEHGVELKGYREHRGSGNAALYIKENPEARLVPMARHTQEVLSNLNKQKRLALERDLPRERIKQIEELAKLQMRRFNERVEAMR